MEPPPTEFIAELPADLSGLSPSGSGPESNTSPSNSQNPVQQYQAYQQPQASHPSQVSSLQQGFRVPRRAVSTSSASILSDPWRIADPMSEEPTKEFFIIADLLFDGLDRGCEPKNTGILEASKVLANWKVQNLAEDAAQIFMHDSFRAFASLWALNGIPHFMVPTASNLNPSFSTGVTHQTYKLPNELPAPSSPYPEYIPALNRAGWYKYLFLELVGEPEMLDKSIPAFCADTYNPTSSGHPDLARWDKNAPQALCTRANQLRTAAIERVCQEAASSMGRGFSTWNAAPVQAGRMNEAEIASKMHGLSI